MFCPICGSKLNTQICSSCGYDGSSDLEAFPTLDKKAAVAPRSTAIHTLNASYNEKIAQLETNDALLKIQISVLAEEVEQIRKLLSSRSTPQPVVAAPLNVPSEAEESTEPTRDLPVLSELKRGDTFIMGRYQRADIEWLVLDVWDNTAVVISKCVLDCRAFDASGKKFWTQASLRKWLNGEFFETVFSKNEQELIVPAALPNTNLLYERLFLLSIDEYYRYFGEDIPAVCKLTEYSADKGAWADSEGNTEWWLRSPGADRYSAICVGSKGNAVIRGYDVSQSARGVRPAMLIKV